jgi:hypothetical protein
MHFTVKYFESTLSHYCIFENVGARLTSRIRVAINSVDRWMCVRFFAVVDGLELDLPFDRERS